MTAFDQGAAEARVRQRGLHIPNQTTGVVTGVVACCAGHRPTRHAAFHLCIKERLRLLKADQPTHTFSIALNIAGDKGIVSRRAVDDSGTDSALRLPSQPAHILVSLDQTHRMAAGLECGARQVEVTHQATCPCGRADVGVGHAGHCACGGGATHGRPLQPPRNTAHRVNPRHCRR